MSSLVNKMLRKEDIQKNLETIEKQIKRARGYLKEKEIDDALYYTWLAAENLVNSLKVNINGFYLTDHKEKSEMLKEYYARNLLNKDYSQIFKILSKFRLAAQFEPYTAVPKDYEKADVHFYLKEINKLKKEVYTFLKQKGIKWSLRQKQK